LNSPTPTPPLWPAALAGNEPHTDAQAQTQALVAQLRAREQRLAMVVHTALDAIVCADPQQQITVFNPTAAMLLQCPEHEALGTSLERFLPSLPQVLTFAQLTTRADLGEITLRTASGHQIAVEASAAFQHQAEGITIILFARDLSARKRTEARRTELEARMREAHKIQAIGTLAGGIAHDFNNILHAILGNLALAQSQCPAQSPLRDHLQEIENAGRRARELVRQILTFSRNEPPLLTAVALADVANETQQLLRVNLPPHITLSIQLPPDLPLVLADVTQAQQALLNLCTNAIHAIDSRYSTERLRRLTRSNIVCGSIRIEACTLQPDWQLRERLELSKGDYVALTVEDDGPGMNDSTLARIFEPFFTTKPTGQGTGLGLPVVHGIMRTHNGNIDVHSTLGVGCRFTLYFPVAPESAQPAPAKTPAAAPPPSPAALTDKSQRHILYVDDDEALVLLVQRVLQRHGYRVSGFSNPHAAMDALHAAPTEYDLLLTDYNMPGYSGLDLLHTALAIRADLPVALTSGYVTSEMEQAALAAGAAALLHKPDDVQALCATVDRLVYPPTSTQETP